MSLSGGELLATWLRLEPVVPSFRQMFGDPFIFHNMEEVAKQYSEWLNARSPGSYDALANFMRSPR